LLLIEGDKKGFAGRCISCEALDNKLNTKCWRLSKKLNASKHAARQSRRTGQIHQKKKVAVTPLKPLITAPVSSQSNAVPNEPVVRRRGRPPKTIKEQEAASLLLNLAQL